MPIWNDPPRRLLNAIRRMSQDRRERGENNFTTSTVLATGAPDSVVVEDQRGQTQVVPVSGSAQLRPGERVTVANVDGRPVLAVAHSARRAQFHPAIPLLGAPVEDLFIADDPKTGLREVWFRDESVLSSLKLRKSLDNNPLNVSWGPRSDSFLVTTVGAPQHHFVFALNRGKDRVLPAGVTPTATLQATYKPETLSIPLFSGLTVAYRPSATPDILFTGVSATLAQLLTGGVHLTDSTGLFPLDITGGLPDFPVLDDAGNVLQHVIVTLTGNRPGFPLPETSQFSLIVDLRQQRVVFSTLLAQAPPLITTYLLGGQIDLGYQQSNQIVRWTQAFNSPLQGPRSVIMLYIQPAVVATSAPNTPHAGQNAVQEQFVWKLAPGGSSVVEDTLVMAQRTDPALLGTLSPNIVMMNRHRVIWQNPFSDLAVRPFSMTTWDAIQQGIHVLDSRGPTTVLSNAFISSLATATQLARLFDQDFLYVFFPDLGQLFSKVWDTQNGTIFAFDQVADKAHEDAGMARFKRLKTLPPGVLPIQQFVQVVNDAAVLGSSAIQQTYRGKAQ